MGMSTDTQLRMRLMPDVLCKTAAMSVFSNITDPFLQISLQQYKKYEFSLTSMADLAAYCALNFNATALPCSFFEA